MDSWWLTEYLLYSCVENVWWLLSFLSISFGPGFTIHDLACPEMKIGFSMRIVCFVTFLVSNVALAVEPSNSLPGTGVLNMTGDIASTLIDGVDRFLLRKIEESVDRRPRHWW